MYVWTETYMGTTFWQCVSALARWTCPHTDPEPAYGVETDSARKSQLVFIFGIFMFAKM